MGVPFGPAGWDAGYLESNFTFVDISHPMADVESLATGE